MSKEQVITPNIDTAIEAVYKRIGYVKKTGKTVIGKSSYSYASESDLIEALRPIMVQEGITMRPHKIKKIKMKLLENINEYQKKEIICFYSAKYIYKLVHAASNTSTKVEAVGLGVDKNGDKSAYKAATGAEKYALSQTFLLARGDDPEKDDPLKQPTSKTPKEEGPALDIDLLLLEIEQAVTSEALEVVYKKHLPSMKQARMSKAEVKELFEPKRLELEQKLKLNGAI
jgi:hypothetical protein